MSVFDRSVAGITCGEVLAELSDLLDGDLPRHRVEQIHEHLAGCQECNRFGGTVTTLVEAVRRQRYVPEPVSEDIRERLRVRLQAAR